MDTLTNSVKLLTTHYQLLDKIGCGTFSSVYKALDIRHDVYDNSFWEPALPISPNAAENSDTDIQKPKKERFVALKQIYATSSPKRMAQEIKILQHLRGAPCVSQLITAFRQHEYVFLVMPYFRHDEFKDCYRSMTMLDTKYYLKSLLTALKHLHSHRILHRDIKPNNFLYNIEMKTGMLIDFGLAQREEETKPPEPPKSNSPIRLNMIRKPARSTSSSTFKQKQTPSTPAALASSNSQPLPTSVPMKAIRANRAGTRGFRAPEVLLRVTHQTVAIDIWSVGVILLSLLSGRYPFFIAHDEGDSLIEIASIFGMTEMKDYRTFETNIETIPPSRKSLSKLCQVLNTEKFKLWAEDDKQNVQNAIDLVGKMLALDYRKRITAEDALKHPFLSDSQIHPLPSPSSSPFPSSSSSSTSSYSSSSSL
ncbi:kinase-like domain-containing protein [Absidia repens]|uniref:non-specific serine/threonine protein kinase n=1 Tax=Absidia repens TaxID=90262 RepID=A0A1X2IFJ2_9FUNG|nr:kinase-like domain-containing protein [Absidia repens]